MAAAFNAAMSGIVTGSTDDAEELWRDIQQQLGADCNIEHMRVANSTSDTLYDDRGAVRWLARHALEGSRPARVTIWSRASKQKAN